jgi:hypothetical protein
MGSDKCALANRGTFVILVVNLGMQLQLQRRKLTSNPVIVRAKVYFQDMEMFLSSFLIGVFAH